MNLIKVKCAFCGKEFFRERGRYNEAKKLGWNQYCSKECQNKTKITRIEKACGNPDCNNKVLRVLNQFKESKSGLIFCSCSCAAIVNNKKYPKRKARLKICPVCRKQFKGVSKYCSKECKLKALRRYTPQELIEIIKRTAQKLKRVPTKRELKEIERTCVSSFGSWNNAIITAGLQPNRSHNQRMYKCTNAKALDGHICDSISELIIDNWLIKNKIIHERNISYPKTNHKADWGINLKTQIIFIEYFGLAKDSPRYDRAIKEKKDICRKYKIKLIEIYPKDLYPKENLDSKLKDKFRDLVNISGCPALHRN